MGIKRVDRRYDDTSMEEYDDGPYIEYEDYVESLKFDYDAEVKKANEAWDGNSDWVTYLDGWLGCARSREVK